MSLKERIFKVSRLFLTIWGGISLLGVIAIGSVLLYFMTLGNTNVEGKAT